MTTKIYMPKKHEVKRSAWEEVMMGPVFFSDLILEGKMEESLVVGGNLMG